MAEPGAVSVVIPACNEAAPSPTSCASSAAARRWREILVVDDGSTDETGARATAAGARVVRHPYNKGNGAAVKTRHPRGDRRVRAHHRRRRPAPARRCAAARRAARRVRPRRRRALDDDAGRIDAAPRQSRAQPARELPDRARRFRISRPDSARRGATCLLEFLHLLPNGFSTPTTTTLAFIKAGYNVAFEPVDARPRVGHVEDPPRRATARSSC